MKIAKTIHLKAFGQGKAISEDQLAKINKYALVPLKSEQVYVRKYLMAHNGIDRNVERFHEEMLEDFAKTLPGKGFFVEGHPSSWSGKGGPGEGLYYDAFTEEMPAEKFKEITGEEIKLPSGIAKAKVLWGEGYLLKLDSNIDTLAKIDAGIYRYVSIGFKAPLFDVTDERGNRVYAEYRSKGEALEGSLVWLGAQPGASIVKAGKTHLTSPVEGGNDEDTILEVKKMKEFLKKLSEKLGKAIAEEQAIDDIVALMAEKDAKIKALEPLAEEGKSYRKHLVDDVLRFGVLIDEVPTDEDGQKKEAGFIATWPIDRMKAVCDKYEVKARAKFPDKFAIKTKDETDKQKKDADGKKQGKSSGRKDYTSAEHNELFETVGK